MVANETKKSTEKRKKTSNQKLILKYEYSSTRKLDLKTIWRRVRIRIKNILMINQMKLDCKSKYQTPCFGISWSEKSSLYLVKILLLERAYFYLSYKDDNKSYPPGNNLSIVNKIYCILIQQIIRFFIYKRQWIKKLDKFQNYFG